MPQYKLGDAMGLHFSATPLFIFSSVLLGLMFMTIGLVWLNLSIGEALVGALLGVLLHWATEIFHHFGHAFAAQRTGYPMTGVRLGFLIGASLYPPTEPRLPAGVHVRRALGGPVASLVLCGVAAILVLTLRSWGGVAWWLAWLLFLDNLANVVQVVIPLGFNDGSTLITWLRRR